MRLVCLSLLIVNIALLAYFLSRPDSALAQPKAEAVRGDLRLLSEASTARAANVLSLDDSSASVKSDIPVVSPSPPIPESFVKPMCSMIGPFDKVFRAKRMVSSLVSLELAPELYTESIKIETGYWVILPSATSREEARKTLRELKAKKIDSFIIREGELDNAISLGVYSKRDRAQVMVEQMSRQGYEVDVSPILKDARQHWVVLSPEDAQKADKDQLRSLLSITDSIKKKQNPCESLALSFNIQ